MPGQFSIVTGRDNPRKVPALPERGECYEAVPTDVAKEAGVLLNDHQQAYYKLATIQPCGPAAAGPSLGNIPDSVTICRVRCSVAVLNLPVPRHSANTLFGSGTSGHCRKHWRRCAMGIVRLAVERAQEMVQYADDPKEGPLSMKIRQLLFL